MGMVLDDKSCSSNEITGTRTSAPMRILGCKPILTGPDGGMARKARVVIPGCPHHVTHRGNLRAAVFFNDDDRRFYLNMLKQCADRCGVSIWAYCLMTNHVHLITVPRHDESLARCLGLAHQRYSSATNARHGWTGNLWANRFYSTPLDPEHLWTAVRYVELNPVRAGLCASAIDFPWSSAACHAGLVADDLLSEDRPFPGRETDWLTFLARGVSAKQLETLRTNTATGRPTGSDTFIKALEEETGRVLRPLKRGAKPSADSPSLPLMDDLFA